MNEIESGLHRVEVGRLKVLEAVNRKLYRVEIWALNDKVNRNGWKYINLESHLAEFQDVPILTAYLRDGKVIGDGHNFDMRIDPKTGEQYASFTAADSERIVGWIPKDANIRIEPEGETKWVVVTGYLWTWYARELVEKIAGQGGGMEVSIETLVTKEHREDGYDVEEQFIVLGVTVLGDGVSPAVAGASIKSLAELRSSMKEEILKAASYIGEKEPETQKSNVKPKERKKINEGVTSRYNYKGAQVLECARNKGDEFSFFGKIAISNRLSASEKSLILEHELSHVKHNHSLEKVFMGFLKVVMWFNPFVYIAAIHIEELQEYEADYDVLASGADKKEYVALIVEQVITSALPVSSKFYSYFTKSRFNWMLNPPRNRKGIAVVPFAICVAVMVFSALQANCLVPRTEITIPHVGTDTDSLEYAGMMHLYIPDNEKFNTNKIQSVPEPDEQVLIIVN